VMRSHGSGKPWVVLRGFLAPTSRTQHNSDCTHSLTAHGERTLRACA
jgi:hypothetical protein